MKSKFNTLQLNLQQRFKIPQTILLFLLIDIILAMDQSETLIKLKDTEQPQTFQCSSSQDEGSCLIQLIPTSSFQGSLEVTYRTLDEEEDLTYKYIMQSLFCVKDKQICDFNGQYLKLRNLSLEIQFHKDQEYYFTLQNLSKRVDSLIITFKVNKGSSCLNNNCNSNSNGKCIVFKGKKQCVCSNKYGGKNCEAVVESFNPNTINKLVISSLTHKVIQYSFKNTAQEIFQSNQLDFIFNSADSQKSDVQKVKFYILDGQSQRINSIHKFDIEQTIDNTININKLFSSSYYTSNLILLIMVINENTQMQNIDVQLRVSDTSVSESSQDEYFIYILIGVIGFTLLIIVFGFIYFIIRRRSLKKNMTNNFNTLAQVLLLSKIELKDTENSDKYQKIFNEVIPSLKMSLTKLKEVTQQSTGKSDQIQNSTEIQISNSCICSICLQQIQEGDRYRETICKHLFHVECIDVWIKKHHNCPMCRVSHKSVDLQRYIKEQKRNLITETHQINGKIFEFEMYDNSLKRINSTESSPLGFIPILPLSLTRQQNSTEYIQELSSPKKVTQTPSPLKTSELQINTLNDSSQYHIPDNSSDLLNLQLPQSYMNESVIPGLIQNNENNIFDNSLNSKNNNDGEQYSTITKIVDIMNNSSSIINHVSNGKSKDEKIFNHNGVLKPILEEDKNSLHSSQAHKSSFENIFINDQFGTSTIFGVDLSTDSDKAMKGSQPLFQQEITNSNPEFSLKRSQTQSVVKLNYNFELQPQAQAQFLKSQLLITPNTNDNNNIFFKAILTK